MFCEFLDTYEQLSTAGYQRVNIYSSVYSIIRFFYRLPISGFVAAAFGISRSFGFCLYSIKLIQLQVS